MKKLKIPRRLIVSCLAFSCVFAFILVSCDSEQIEPQSINKEEINLSKKANRPDRIDICHYDEDTQSWMKLTVSEASWDEHSLHGDQWLDRDGDGFTAPNECGIGTVNDCDDNDASINPDATDICGDSIDNNCDGIVDEDCGGACEVECAIAGFICDYLIAENVGCYSINPGVFAIFDTTGRLIVDNEMSPEFETCNNFLLEWLNNNQIPICGD